MVIAIGGFADLQLYSETDYKGARWRRDLGETAVATKRCAKCGSPAGQLCTRQTADGQTVARRLPHFGRGVGGTVHRAPNRPKASA